MGIMRDNPQNILPQPASAITAPVLIVWGEDDRWVSLSAGEKLHAAIPGSEWATFPRAGHLPMEEQAEAFNKRVIEFLQK